MSCWRLRSVLGVCSLFGCSLFEQVSSVLDAILFFFWPSRINQASWEKKLQLHYLLFHRCFFCFVFFFPPRCPKLVPYFPMDSGPQVQQSFPGLITEMLREVQPGCAPGGYLFLSMSPHWIMTFSVFQLISRTWMHILRFYGDLLFNK